MPPRRRPQASATVACGLALLGLLLLPARSVEPPLPEYQVKAAFLYNFAVLTEWPAGTFVRDDTPVVIGVLGADPFGGLLEKTLAGKRLGERPLRVARYAKVAEIDHCHILFIGAEEAAKLPQILKELARRSILTVGETDNFARSGGMLQMSQRADSTIGLRVNLAAVANAQLKLSSKLLRLAAIVRDVPNQKEGK